MTIRKYQVGDEQGILQLFEKVFKQQRTHELWEWKFIKPPERTNPFIIVYEEEGKILGHLGLWVGAAYVDGHQSKIGLRVDTMVDPDARGKGIYAKLNEHLLVMSKEENITFLYGFPAPNAKKLFQRYTDAVHMINMPRWINVLRPFALASSKTSILNPMKFIDISYFKFKLKKMYKAYSGSLIQEVTRCNEDFNKLASKTKNIYKVQLERNAAYLNWRYFQHPENTYIMYGLYVEKDLKGYIVYKKDINTKNGIRSGIIMDLIVDDIENATIITDLLLTALKNMDDVDIVQTWSLPDQVINVIYKNLGFIHKDSPMPLVGKAIADDGELLTNYRSWLINPGDVDSF